MSNQISLKDNFINDKARWESFQQSLLGLYGKDVYTSWLQNINFTKINFNTLVLNVKTRFIRDWIVAHYADKILDLYKKLDTNITRIEFQISERVELKNNNKSNIIDFEKKDFIQDSGSYGLSKIDERLVFDNFIVGKSNELAFTAANRIIDNLNKYNPLYIYGGVGLGKTHLLNAIGNKLLKKIDKVIYVSAERFMYQFVRSIKNNDVVKFKDIFRSAKVLIIDDIQFVSGKDVTQEEFFHTFNALIESGSQIVISCDRPPNELDRIQDRNIINHASLFFKKILEEQSPFGLEVELKNKSIEEFDERIKKVNWHMAYKQKPFEKSCEALFSWSPIADQLKDLDKEIVVNSMDVQWQNIMIDFVKLLKPLDANVR